jgi:type IV fimbrial biogenesis protein FimT
VAAVHERRVPVVSDRPARERGFTMMELLVAVSIAAVLFAIGVPMFRDAALGSRLSAAANNLLASVQLARSEAIKRNVNVTLCASSDGTSCAGAGGWEQGWITIIDPADPSTVVQYQQGLPAGYQMTQTGGTTDLVFQPIGIGASAAEITVCRLDPIGSQERVLSLRATGTANVTATTAGVCPD